MKGMKYELFLNCSAGMNILELLSISTDTAFSYLILQHLFNFASLAY